MSMLLLRWSLNLLTNHDRNIINSLSLVAFGIGHKNGIDGNLYYLFRVDKSQKEGLFKLKSMISYVKDYPYGIIPYGILHMVVIKPNKVVQEVLNKFMLCEGHIDKTADYTNLYPDVFLDRIKSDKTINLLSLEYLNGKEQAYCWQRENEIFE